MKRLPSGALAALLLLSTALLGANCKSKDGPTPVPEAVKPATPTPPTNGLSEAEAALRLPGFDTSTLSPKQRAELVELADDAFCPCGAGNKPVGACLRDGAPCKAALRMLELSKKMLLAGVSGTNALVKVETYLASFQMPNRKAVPTEGPSEGSPKAPVTIVEFSDFQCPACRAAHPALEELIKKRGADVRWVFRNYPLPQHEHAQRAAQCGAWAAAHDAEKFWPLAGQFFGHQDELSPEKIGNLAKAVGLDAAAMAKGCDAAESVAQVEADKKAGNDLGVTGTPSIFINGRPLAALGPTFDNLSWTVDDELEWIANGNSWGGKKAKTK